MSFIVAVKSTLDKVVYDIAQANNYEFFDMDGAYMSADIAESTKPALAVSLSSIYEYPRDPFYQIQFEVGARTSEDESQYESLEAIALLQAQFRYGNSFSVMDYSSATPPTVRLGEIIVHTINTSPAAFDKVSGLRSLHVTATVQRF